MFSRNGLCMAQFPIILHRSTSGHSTESGKSHISRGVLSVMGIIG